MVKAIIQIDGVNYTNSLPTFVEGEFGFDINFTLLDDDDTAIDLTNKTVKFQTININDTVKKIDGTCTIVSATAGTCKYSVLETDMDAVAIYEAEVEIFEDSVSNRKIKLGTFSIFSEV